MFEERRRYPRQSLGPKDGIQATLVLPGTSLIFRKGSPNQIEIEGRPVDISRGGLRVEISFEAPWQSIVNRKEIDIRITKKGFETSVRGKVVHTRMKNKVVGVSFEAPIGDIAPLLLPKELNK